MGIGGGINDIIFNNYIVVIYKIFFMVRGVLEFLCEILGFLIIFFIGFLYFFGDLRVSIIVIFLCLFFLIGFGFFVLSFLFLIVWIVIYNIGIYFNMVLILSIGMEFLKEDEYGKILGFIGFVVIVVFIIGYFIVMVGFKFLNFFF